MIIDCHSHFGNDYYCGNIDLDSYIKSTYDEYISRDFKYYVLKEN